MVSQISIAAPANFRIGPKNFPTCTHTGWRCASREALQTICRVVDQRTYITKNEVIIKFVKKTWGVVSFMVGYRMGGGG